MTQKLCDSLCLIKERINLLTIKRLQKEVINYYEAISWPSSSLLPKTKFEIYILKINIYLCDANVTVEGIRPIYPAQKFTSYRFSSLAA